MRKRKRGTEGGAEDGCGVGKVLYSLEKTRAWIGNRFSSCYVSRGGDIGFWAGKRRFWRAETYGFRMRDVENERADGGMDR